MKRWISTSYAWFWFGPEVAHHNDKNRKFSEGINDAHFYLPDRQRMVQAVDDFVSQANELQMEVKGVIPLQGATAETYAHSAHQTNSSMFTNQSYGWGWGWGLGYGYGASYTGGFLVILQSEEMIDAAEYQARIARNMAERNRRDEIVSLEAELELAQGRLSELKQAAQAAITFKRASFPTCYGPEFIAEAVRDWIKAVGAKTAYIEPGSPWENGYCESFNGRMREELLTVRSSTRSGRPRSSSKDGETTTIPNDHTVHWATALQRQRPS